MKRILGIGIAVLLAGAAQAALIVNTAPYNYSQNFDTLAVSGTGNVWAANSTLSGWYWNMTDATREPSTYGYIADPGINNTGAGHSYGASNATDRAIGGLSGNRNDMAFGVQFRNTTGQAINLSDVKVSYVGELWRQNTATGTLVFNYATNATALTSCNPVGVTWSANTLLDFSKASGTAGALDGNLAANKTTFTDVVLSASGEWRNNDYLFLRWSKTGTNSQGYSADDFSIEIIPEPASFGLLALGAIGVRLLRRRRV